MKIHHKPSLGRLFAVVSFNLILLAGSLSAQWLGVGAGGAGTDFNDTTNWTGGTINGSFVSNSTTSTILLSADHSIAGAGLTFFSSNAPTQPIVTTINGTAGGSLEVLTINGNVALNKSAALAPSITGNWSNGSSTINVSSAAGLVVGQLVSGGNGLVPGTVITGISGTNVTISIPTYGAQVSNANLTVASGVILGSDLELSLSNSIRTFRADAGSGANNGVIIVDALVSSTGSGGGVSINGGTLVLNNANNSFTNGVGSGGAGEVTYSSAGALGNGGPLAVNNSSLAYVGTGAISLNRSLGNNNSGNFNNNSYGGASSTITLDGTISLTGGTLTLGGANKTATNIVNSTISGGGNFRVGSGIFNDFGGAIWRVASTNNDYTGTTSVHTGTLEFLTIGNVGAGNSSLGAPTTVSAGTISMGNSGFATLRYLGTGGTSDRQISIADAGSVNNVTLDSSGSGAWQMTTGIVYNGSGQAQNSRPVFLDGNNTNANTIGDITFNYSRASGANGNASVTKNGTGLWVLGGSNSYNLGGGGTAGTYTTTVNNGTLRLGNANALPGGIGSAGGTSFLTINGGVLELGAGNFSRGLGTNASTVNLLQGGFSAWGADRTVNLGGASAGVTWGSGNFMTTGGAAFQLSSAVSDATVDFQNPINLGTNGTNTRTIQVNNGSAAVDAILSGAITSSGGVQSLAKTGAGALLLGGTNTYSGGTLVSAGQLIGSTASLQGAITNNAMLTFNLATNGTYAGVLSGAGTLTKVGAGTLSLTASNAFTGSTTVSDGSLQLASGGVLRFIVGTSGSNNSVTTAGPGSAVFDGTFQIDLSGAATNAGSTWNLVSPTSVSYGTNFSVDGFTNNSGTWSFGTNGVTYSFNTASGILSVPSPAGGYNSWLTNYPSLGTNTNKLADPDLDGFPNVNEFAFDGNPTVGSPALASATAVGTNIVVSFIARTNTNEVTYLVLSTTNLATGPWTNNAPATASITNSADQSGVLLTNDYLRREFSVPRSGGTFYRIRASVAD